MVIEPALLLERMSITLRGDVGPAVTDEFARTQAFMASVILAKLASQLAAGDDDGGDHATLAAELRAGLPDPPAAVAGALDALAADGATARWNDLVAALYAHRAELDLDAALAVVRPALRARLDRQLRHAR